MDWKGGLTKLEAEIYKPRQTIDTDTDIVMAYKLLLRNTKHTVIHRWVLGHADEKKKDKPAYNTTMEQENIECDA